MTVYEELNIGFYLYMQGKFYSEFAIAQQLSHIKKIANSKDYNWPTMDGAISILYKGEELLGKAYMEAILVVHVDTPGLLEGKASEEYLPLSGHFISFTPEGKTVKYDLSYVKTREVPIKSCYLPLVAFIQKWGYMKYRLIRLRAYLTDTEKNVKEWESWGYGTEKWKRVVGVDKIDVIMSEDIVEVLTDTRYRQ